MLFRRSGFCRLAARGGLRLHEARRSRQQCGQLIDLCFGEVGDHQAVVKAQTCAYELAAIVSDAVERSEGDLENDRERSAQTNTTAAGACVILYTPSLVACRAGSRREHAPC